MARKTNAGMNRVSFNMLVLGVRGTQMYQSTLHDLLLIG